MQELTTKRRKHSGRVAWKDLVRKVKAGAGRVFVLGILLEHTVQIDDPKAIEG